MKEYHFQITLIGTGDTPEDAWEDVCEFAAEAPGNLGDLDKEDIVKVEEIKE